MSGREAVRVLVGLPALRGGVGILRACMLSSQCRWTSTEAQDAGSIASESHRRASSWLGAAERSISRGHRGPGTLLRAQGDRPASSIESTTTREPNATKYFIDTQAMVRTLEENGAYSREQAECLVSLLSTTLSSSLDPVVATQVTRKDMELLEVRVAGEVDLLRSDLVLLERSTVDTLRNENEALRAQIKKLSEVLKEEVMKVQSGVQLDLNLEKSRLKEESTNLEQQIKDTNNRIQTEVAQLKTQMESQKLESIKYLAGGIFSVVTIVLSVMLGLSRLLK